MLGLVGGLMILGVQRARHFMMKLLVAAVIAGIVLVGSGVGDHLVNQLNKRLNVFERKVSNAVDERGYSRILEFPEYILLGAGEGARYRFGDRHSHELHSTFGTLLFSYGVPGLLLFLGTLWMILRRKVFSIWVLASAPLVYSLTHQGMRMTWFWIFLLLVAFYGPQRARKFLPKSVLVAQGES